MISPEEAKKIVKNRNAREARAAFNQDLKDEYELDYAEQLVSEYLANSNFLEEFDNMVERTLPMAIDKKSMFIIGVCVDSNNEELWHENSGIYGGRAKIGQVNFYLVAANLVWIGFDFDNMLEIAEIFAETIQSRYQEVGWNTEYFCHGFVAMLQNNEKYYSSDGIEGCELLY